MKKQFILSVLSIVTFPTLYGVAEEQGVYNPFGMMREQRKRMMQEMTDIFDAFDQDFFTTNSHVASVATKVSSRTPEIRDENGHLLVSFDLGQTTDDVRAKYEDNSLVVEAPAAGAKVTIASEKHNRKTFLSVQAEVNTKKEKKDKESSYVNQAYAVTAKQKCVDGALDIENASINVEKNILKVSVPKKVGKMVNVTIKGAEAENQKEEK